MNFSEAVDQLTSLTEGSKYRGKGRLALIAGNLFAVQQYSNGESWFISVLDELYATDEPMPTHDRYPRLDSLLYDVLWDAERDVKPKYISVTVSDTLVKSNQALAAEAKKSDNMMAFYTVAPLHTNNFNAKGLKTYNVVFARTDLEPIE